MVVQSQISSTKRRGWLQRATVAGAAAMVIAAMALPRPVTAETLAQTLSDAYEHSGLLDQNRALLRAADENVAQTVAGLRPIINWTADVTRTFGRASLNQLSIPTADTDFNVAISLDLLLYDFGRTQLQIQAAKETVLATREQLRGIEQLVLLRAVAAYMDVRREGELVAVRQNNLRLLREELRAAEDRFEVGEVTRTDVALAEAALASARAGLAVAQGNLTQAVEEFTAAVGRPPGNLQPPGPLPRLSGDIDGAKSIAVRKHPDILRGRFEVASAELTVAAAEAAMKPRLSFTSRIGTSEEIGESDNNRVGSFGLEVTGPIYQGGFLTSAVRQAMAQRDSLRGALHETRHEVVQDVGNAYSVLLSAQASRQAGLEQVRAARVAFQGLREEAQLGARTTLDVLDAEQNLLDAQGTAIEAEADLYIAAYAVLESIGELTAKDLRLRVQLYDPEGYYNLVKDAPVAKSPQGRKLDRVLKALGRE
ncbi:MAG: TolC family outer membrane protein [Pseudomonadota bacterium]